MTKQDVDVGVSVISTIVSAGTALEAKGAFETTVAIVSAANSIDDVTVNTSGQSGLQRATANRKGASNTVTFVKTASSVTLLVYIHGKRQPVGIPMPSSSKKQESLKILIESKGVRAEWGIYGNHF